MQYHCIIKFCIFCTVCSTIIFMLSLCTFISEIVECYNNITYIRMCLYFIMKEGVFVYHPVVEVLAFYWIFSCQPSELLTVLVCLLVVLLCR